MSSPSSLTTVRSHRDILVHCLDSWMMIQEERFRTDCKLFRELAEDAYDTCVSAVDALHALLREHDEDSDSESESESEAVVATVAAAGVAEASDHDCGAAHPVTEADDYFRRKGYPDGWTAAAPVAEPHSEATPVSNPFTTIRDLAPQLEAVARRVGAAAAAVAVPEAEHFAASAYFRDRGYPEGQIQIMKRIWAAYKMGKEAGRQAELENGGWATLPNKKRIMIFKGHAFEPPTDRLYSVPGPLKHLGLYDRGGARVVPSDEVPAIPQTRDDYPWWKLTA